MLMRARGAQAQASRRRTPTTRPRPAARRPTPASTRLVESVPVNASWAAASPLGTCGRTWVAPPTWVPASPPAELPPEGGAVVGAGGTDVVPPLPAPTVVVGAAVVVVGAA